MASTASDGWASCAILEVYGGRSGGFEDGTFPVGLPAELRTGDRVFLVGYTEKDFGALFTVDSDDAVTPSDNAYFGVTPAPGKVPLKDLRASAGSSSGSLSPRTTKADA